MCSLAWKLQPQPDGAHQPMIGQLKLALTRRFVCGAVAMGKRKAQLKLYAVRVGRETGIFYSWDDCIQQVSFDPHNALPPLPRMCRLCCSAALQLSAVPQTSAAQVHGFSGAQFKSFGTQAQAEAYLYSREGQRAEPPAPLCLPGGVLWAAGSVQQSGEAPAAAERGVAQPCRLVSPLLRYRLVRPGLRRGKLFPR